MRFCLKNQKLKRGSLVKSTCSYRGLGFSFQHPYAQLSSVSHLTLFSDLQNQAHMYYTFIHFNKTFIHINVKQEYLSYKVSIMDFIHLLNHLINHLIKSSDHRTDI